MTTFHIPVTLGLTIGFADKIGGSELPGAVSISVSRDGAVELSTPASSAPLNLIQATLRAGSSNWATLTKFVGSSEATRFQDTFASNFSSRFYRWVSILSPTTYSPIATVAGRGQSGSYTGDDELAINAGLSGPAAVAADGVGNLFVADEWNNVIRKIDTNGIITAVAGDG